MSWLKELQEELDIKKKLPKDYINKWIFRSVIGLMILILIIVFLTNNYKISFAYASCEKDFCKNPFYICPTGVLYDDCTPLKDMPSSILNECKNSDLCYNKYLMNNESIGVKPNFFALNFNNLCLIIVALGFVLNHIFWKVKK